MRKETQCVHSGAIKDTISGGVNSPIFMSTAFNYLDREHVAYPRYFNTPNQNAVVAKVCALEWAEDGVLFSSGMAAMSTAILSFAGSGAMLSFELDEAKVAPDRFVRGLRLIKPAVSLGGIESTVCAPAVTSHAKISAAERKRIGISDLLLRLSVGIEQADDLLEDIEQAIRSAG